MELGCSSVGLPGWSARVVVNVLGACAIGILFARLCDVDGRGIPVGFSNKNRLREQLWGAGFLGGFTTFSALALEAVDLIDHDKWPTAVLYLGVTVGAGLLAVQLGIRVAQRMVKS